MPASSAATPALDYPDPATTASRALVVSSVFWTPDVRENIGREAYSYFFVYRALAPLLNRWGVTREVTHPESRLDYALRLARESDLAPVHLSFLPLHLMYLTPHAPNVAFPFWEFPDIPDRDFGRNPRNNWARIANRLDLVLTASTFTRDAFQRAGLTTPIRVVPVPVDPRHAAVPDWVFGQRLEQKVPGYIFPQAAAARPLDRAGEVSPVSGTGLARRLYRRHLRAHLPERAQRFLALAAQTRALVRESQAAKVEVPYQLDPSIALDGVVYTSILNPYDPRKNWQDLISAFLLALGQREDATLLLKLVLPPELAAAGVNLVAGYYAGLGLSHRARLILVNDFLSDQQMIGLARGSTFYVNTARAEGACLPLQDFLAAGRPGLAPLHTSLVDYFDESLGFVLDSHPEPAAWPHDPEQRLSTSWHRLVWQSLHDRLRESYALATGSAYQYQQLAARGRARIEAYASARQVWPKLHEALDLLEAPSGSRVR